MKVRWHCLALEGFGRYHGPVRVDFSDGLNTLVSPNESGKSTLVSGLVAVLFGLLNTDSRDAFSTGRFLNWERPAGFRGALLFSSGDRHYRIERQFESNRVHVEELVRPGVWQTLVTGEHNPQAHKKNKRYEDTMASLTGIGSRELFERTFVVTQPLPETGELDIVVQELVSGGGAAAEKALSILEDRLRAITKSNASYGVGMSNARSDRELDVLERRIVEKQAALRGGAHLLDDLPKKRLELQAATDRRREIETALYQTRGTVTALAEWRSARNSYEIAVRQKDSYQKALEHLIEVSRRASSLRGEISGKYASFSSLGPDTGERLLEMQGLQAAISGRNAEIERLSAQCESLGATPGVDVGAHSQAERQAQGSRSTRANQHPGVPSALRALVSLAIGAACFAGALWLFPAGAGPNLPSSLLAMICSIAGAALGWMLLRPSARGVAPQAPGPAEAELKRLLELRETQGRLDALAAEQQRDTARLAVLEGRCSEVLDSVSGSIDDAIAAWRAYLQVEMELAGLERESRGALQGHSLSNEDELRSRLTDADMRARRALDMWEALVSQHPALPAADLGADPQALSQKQQSLQAELERLEQQRAEAEQELIRLSREVQALESAQPVNIAQLQEQISKDIEQAAMLRLRARSIAVAHQELRMARNTFQSTHRDVLAARITQRFAQLSGVPRRKVTLDDDFHIGILVDSQPCSQAQLSQGARDQLYVAIRLAIADLVTAEEEVPFVFDDPFLTFDETRLGEMRDSLLEMATSRQIILLSHREEIASWGRRIVVEEPSDWCW